MIFGQTLSTLWCHLERILDTDHAYSGTHFFGSRAIVMPYSSGFLSPGDYRILGYIKPDAMTRELKHPIAISHEVLMER